MDPASWSWAQWVLAVWWLAELMMQANAHGKPKEGKHDFFLQLFQLVVWAGLLHVGGFW